ncbi:solute carrier family 22 member 6-B-like [Ixodes scapularis]|uniref:solute carrier family 22 member 6-B-like n=1 Tax=Ixodes scapularis TaxID=6945 RepID=UPI001A9EC2DC|nr:solute carrier family 22 member 6-B-like [Ixodes scapularis]
MKASFLLALDRTASAPTAPLDAALVFGHGTFQRLALMCATLSIFIAVSNSLVTVVFARPVEHWCRPPPELAYMPTDVWKNQSIPVEPDGTFSKCTRYEPPLDAGNATENRTVVFCDEWDYALATTGKSIVSEWNLVCHRHRLLLLHPLVYFGGAVAGSVIGCLGDSFGRKPVFLVALLLLVASGMATIFSNTVLTFIILRFVTSVTSLTVLNMASVLLFEVTKTTHRVVFCAFAASCTSAAVTLFHFLLLVVGGHWRVAQAMLMVPTIFLLFASYAIEESPCWLLALGDIQGTERAVVSAAKVNGYPLDDVKAKMNKIKYEMLRRGNTQMNIQQPSPLDLVLNSSLRFRSITLFSSAFMTLLHYYDTNFNKTLVENRTVHIILIVARLPVSIAFLYILHYLSRRRMLCVALLHMSVLLGFQTWLDWQEDDSILPIVTIIFKGIVLDMIPMAMFVYLLEIFPTVLRATSFSLCTMFGRSGGVLLVFIRGPNQPISRALAMAVSTVIFTLIGLAVLALPETTKVKATNTIRETELEDMWQESARDNATRLQSMTSRLDVSKRS